MEDKILYGDFVDFLKINGAYNEFLINSRLAFDDLEDYFNIYEINNKELIMSAFVWEFTKDGSDYWEKLNDKFMVFLDNYKIAIRRRKVKVLGW